MKSNLAKIFIATVILLIALIGLASGEMDDSNVSNGDGELFAEKKTANLGSRMCRWDSRYYKLRKKFDKVFPLDHLKQWRFNFYLANALKDKNFIDSLAAQMGETD